jgi:hypothetical protein
MIDLSDPVTTVKFLLRDRDSRFTAAFDVVFTADSIRILTSPPQPPRANAIYERMIGTLRRELLDRNLIVNEHHLRRILATYLHHFNTARPHRTLGNSHRFRLRPIPHRRSTSPTTKSAADPSSTGSPANISSQHDANGHPKTPRSSHNPLYSAPTGSVRSWGGLPFVVRAIIGRRAIGCPSFHG